MTNRPRILRSHRKMIGPLEMVNPHAAGIDAGSEHHLVSVPEECSKEPVRTFGTFTCELEALAEWLIECGITTVAVEATGVYWIPLYEILDQRGLNPKLIDSRSLGRRNKKTDVLDCQWIRQLHTHGLLDGAFRPPSEVLPLRAFTRQRKMLVEYASDHIRHIQKALELMNVKLHLIVSDTVGVTGLRIIHAILDGQRDPARLARLRDPGCRASEQEFVKALIGNYREEHLFTLKQAVELFDVYQAKIAECDRQIENYLSTLEKRNDPKKQLANKSRSGRRKNQPHFDGRTLLYERVGIDLTALPGLDSSSLLTILSETGTDMSPWPSGKSFASWLALSPNRRITGGKQIRKSGPVVRPNRAAQAFRIAAQTLERAQCGLGAFFRRMRSRHGRQSAIKDTAHKLAMIFYLDAQTSHRVSRSRRRLLRTAISRQSTQLPD